MGALVRGFLSARFADGRDTSDDAVIRDRESGVFTDPSKVHPIRHEGKYFKVPGFHLCEPSPQRTPVIFQAGASARGRAFAARHAEAMFVLATSPETARKLTDAIRAEVAAAGGDGTDRAPVVTTDDQVIAVTATDDGIVVRIPDTDAEPPTGDVIVFEPDEIEALVTDEVAHILSGADGLEIITEVVKRGRKEKAAAILGDQDCEFGSQELRGLLKTRVAMRHTDKTLARKALDWVGLDPDAEDVLEEYTTNTAPITRPARHATDKPYVKPERRGEGYMRDASGAVGRIKVLRSFRTDRKPPARPPPRRRRRRLPRRP